MQKREKETERKLVSAVKAAGGLCPKMTSPGFDGMPDRLILMPGGRAAFAEVKRSGGKPRPLQLRRAEQLGALGFRVFLLDDDRQIPEILKEVTQ